MNPIQANPHGYQSSDKHEALLAPMIAEILKTRETKQLIYDLVPGIIRHWAGDSWVKQKMVWPLERFIQQQFYPRSDSMTEATLASLMADPTFASTLSKLLPEVLADGAGALNVLMENVSDVSMENKEAFVAGMLGAVNKAGLGTWLTVIFKAVNDLHQQNPRYFAETLEPVLRQWIEKLDIGELRDMVDQGHEDVEALIKAVLDILWCYPSKLVLLLSFLTDIANVLTFFVTELLSVLNRISPDLLADVALSIFRGIKGDQVGKMLNEVAEIFRKVHTGSALIGEPGTTQLPIDLGKFIRDMMGAVDTELLWKVRIAFLKEKDIFLDTVHKTIKTDARDLDKALTYKMMRTNQRLKYTNQRLSRLEDLGADAAATAMTAASENLEVEEAGEIINQFVGLMNQIRTESPDMFNDLVSRFVNSVDFFELKELVGELGEALADDLLPMGRAIIPKVVMGICSSLSPMDDEYEEDAEQARTMLRSLLAGEEVQS